jgi:hypothetical protein
MQAHLDLTLREIDLVEDKAESKGVGHYIRKAWKSITEHVTFKKDGIFEDPNWPHLWS